MRFNYSDGRLPVSMTMGSITYYLAYDQVGSLRTTIDSFGNIVKRMDYDSFGNILLDTNPVFSVPFGFAGGLHDRDTDLVRFGLRDYDPAIGKWTAKDPIDFKGGDTNLFNYTGADPVNYIDPEGESYLIPIIAGVLIAAEVWNNIIYPLLHPTEPHEHEPHLETEVCHPINPKTLPPQRLPKQPPQRPKPIKPYKLPGGR